MTGSELLARVLLCSVLCSSLCCAARPPKQSVNGTVPAESFNGTIPGNFTNATVLDGPANTTNAANATNATQPGIGRRSVKVPQGRAVKGVPILRTNLSELQDPDHAHEDTALIQAITEPPAFYAPNLDRHNAYRAQHTSTPPLAWDDAVADSAAVYASRCIWGHDQNNKYGENLYAYAYSLDNDKAAFQMAGVKAWYDEIALYSYSNPGFSEATGHFSQVVWKSSARLGCAVASCPQGMVNWSAGRVYLVCRYSPPGNYIGQFALNVMPVGSIAATPPAASASQPAPQPAPACPSPRSLPPNPSPKTTTPSAPAPASPPPAAPASMLATPMEQGQKLLEGRCLVSPNTVYKFCLKTGGDLQVLNSRTGAARSLWSSPFTFSLFSSTRALTLLPTGKLNVVSSSMLGVDITLWSANTDNMGVGPYRLLLQDDGNVSVYDSRSVRTWHAGTAGL